MDDDDLIQVGDEVLIDPPRPPRNMPVEYYFKPKPQPGIHIVVAIDEKARQVCVRPKGQERPFYWVKDGSR